MDVQRFALEGSNTPIVVFTMPDRRTAAQRPDKWILQAQARRRAPPAAHPSPPLDVTPWLHGWVRCLRQVEQCLYGSTGGGAVYRLLQRESLSSCPLALRKGSVLAGHVTAQEYDQFVKELEAISPLETRGRVRAVTVLSLNVAIKLAHAIGRGTKSIAFLRAMQTPLPRLWEALEEQDANERELGGVDLALDHEIAELEEEDCHLALELVASHVPYATDEHDDERAASWRLPSVPAGLQTELDALVRFRTDPINRQRDGSCCVDLTVGNDVATCKRFLGWLLATKEVTAGLGVFCRAALSEWVEEWLRALREKRLRFSTCSNYCNSLIMVCNFVYCTYELDAAVQTMITQQTATPCDELIRLRCAQPLSRAPRIL